MEDTIASFSSKAKEVPSTLMFVSGGTFNLASGNNEESTNTSRAGQILEYKLEPKKSASSIDVETSISVPSTSDHLDYGSAMSEIGALSEEFKRKHELREEIRAHRAKQSSNLNSLSTTQSLTLRSTNLRINGLPGWWSASTLQHDFSCYGQVLSTKVIALRFDDRRTTCGYILFANRSSAEIAKYEREGTNYAGLPVTFEWVPPPSDLAALRKSKGFSQKDTQSENVSLHSQLGLVPDYLKRETNEMKDDDLSHFLSLIHGLTASRPSIAQLSEWMISNDHYAAHVTQLWTDEICSPDSASSTIAHKIALLFLASDVLHNVKSILDITHNSFDAQNGRPPNLVSPTDFKHLWVYHATFYRVFPAVFRVLGEKRSNIPGRISAKTFDDYIRSVLTSWRKSNIFTPHFLDIITKAFTEPESEPFSVPQEAISDAPIITPVTHKPTTSPQKDAEEGIDGIPITDYRGLPIDFDEAINDELIRILNRSRTLSTV